MYDQLQELYDRVRKYKNGELLAGLFYLIFCFQNRKVPYDFSEELEQILDSLKTSRERRVWENCYVLYTFLEGSKTGADEMSRWLLYDSPEEKESNMQENCFLLSLKVRGYLWMNQYRKAVNLSEKLVDYYEKHSLEQFQTECLFEQAAALYESGRKKEAIIGAAKALALGVRFRYVDLYTHYGDTGVLLIEEYQKLIGIKKSAKKQYYYGNVLRATYEGYQSILLRCANKARKHALSSQKKEKTDNVKLTMTELAILQYINNGYGNQGISEMMNIKITTVKSHIYNIYRKLEVSTRVQAINEAREKGLVEG